MVGVRALAAMGVASALVLTGLDASATENAFWGITYEGNGVVSFGIFGTPANHVYQFQTCGVTSDNNWYCTQSNNVEDYEVEVVNGTPWYGASGDSDLACYEPHFVSAYAYVWDVTTSQYVYTDPELNGVLVDYYEFTPTGCN